MPGIFDKPHKNSDNAAPALLPPATDAAFLPDDPEEEMEDDMEWNPPEDAKSKEQMLAEIKAGIAKRKERQDKKKAELERQKEIFRKTYKIDI